jgi:hypothetical protein
MGCCCLLDLDITAIRLLVDLGQELVVAEERVLVLANLDGAAAELVHAR